MYNDAHSRELPDVPVANNYLYIYLYSRPFIVDPIHSPSSIASAYTTPHVPYCFQDWTKLYKSLDGTLGYPTDRPSRHGTGMPHATTGSAPVDAQGKFETWDLMRRFRFFPQETTLCPSSRRGYLYTIGGILWTVGLAPDQNTDRTKNPRPAVDAIVVKINTENIQKNVHSLCPLEIIFVYHTYASGT